MISVVALGSYSAGYVSHASTSPQLVNLTVSYTVPSGVYPENAPMFNYSENHQYHEFLLPRFQFPKPLSVDYGSEWFAYASNGTSRNDRWAVAPQEATGNATVDESIIFKYYHEFQLNASYGVSFGGTLPRQPIIRLFQGDEQNIIPLRNQSFSYWADEGNVWAVNQTFDSAVAGERWSTGNSTGVVTAPGNLNVTYLHQYLLTMQVSPSGSGVTVPSNEAGVENWQNASSRVAIQASPNTGFSFQDWSCTTPGCYYGTGNPAQVVMLGPVTEIAEFNTTIIVQSAGSDVTQHVIVDNVTIAELPHSFSWAPNSNHTLRAMFNVSCGFSFLFFNGCTYGFNGWTVNGASQSGNTLTVTADKPKTVTATYSKNYFNLEILIVGAAAAASVIIVPLRRRQRHLKPSPTELLPSLAGPVGLAYRIGCLSDLGKTRSNNEDSVSTMKLPTIAGSKLSSPILAAVADGVGGSQKGEVASKLTLTSLGAQVSRTPIDSEHVDLSGVLRSAVESANDEVVKYGMAHRESEGLASTVIAAIIEGNMGHIANVGDSRAYLVNRGGIRQLSKDHSQVQELVDAGKLTSEQARHTAGRNVITRAVGASTDVQVDTYKVSLSPGDRILLCTDGLWEPVTDSEIQKLVMECKDPQAACEKLVALANDRGGKDNVSVIIVEMKGPIEPDEP
jgi:serine/threonine protein phosphatase PrpC